MESDELNWEAVFERVAAETQQVVRSIPWLHGSRPELHTMILIGETEKVQVNIELSTLKTAKEWDLNGHERVRALGRRLSEEEEKWVNAIMGCWHEGSNSRSLAAH